MTGSRSSEINPKEGLYDEGGKHTVHWFRKGLRLHDNPSLREGLAGASTFRCVFVLDPWFAGSTNIGINKWRWVSVLLQYIHELNKFLSIDRLRNHKIFRKYFSIRFVNRFLLQCLEDLDCSLRKLNSRLFVIRGQPADALPKLFKEWGTTNLTFEEDPEPFGRVRDHNISALCKELGISVVQKVSHTLYKLDEWV